MDAVFCIGPPAMQIGKPGNVKEPGGGVVGAY